MTKARISRGPCDHCAVRIKPGDDYEQRIRYARVGEAATPGLAGGRVSVPVHIACRDAWRATLTERSKAAWRRR